MEGGGECNFSLTIYKLFLLLQLPINSYTVDARITKPIYITPLYIPDVGNVFEIFSPSSSFEIIWILVILPKNAISL